MKITIMINDILLFSNTLKFVFITTREEVVEASDSSRAVFIALSVCIGIWTTSTNFSQSLPVTPEEGEEGITCDKAALQCLQHERALLQSTYSAGERL